MAKVWWIVADRDSDHTARKFALNYKPHVRKRHEGELDLVRLLRIDYARQKGNQQQLEEEQENLGHRNWKPIDRPDWLLLEIDANMLIRPGQVDVALATISPVSKSNSVLQMNMGQVSFFTGCQRLELLRG
jgi:hypothetical protein